MNQRQAWFPMVTKGIFGYGGTTYHTFGMVDAQASAINWTMWNQANYRFVRTERGNCCGKIVKERVRIIDPYTIQVEFRPLYFWDGPRGDAPAVYNWGYPKDTSGPADTAFDVDETIGITSGSISANNPWPRYVPPNIIDYPIASSDYGFYPGNYSISMPEYSHGINIYVNRVLIKNSIIETYDFWNGIIKFKWPINLDDLVEVTYLYEQNKAIITDVNLNPIYPELFDHINSEFLFTGQRF